MSTALFWHRRDLRIQDNAGLYKALKNNTAVIPVFIFDSSILGLLPGMISVFCLYIKKSKK